MHKLSEESFTEHIKCLIYGDSGTGKTCFAASFPGPIEFWDFDGKVSSAARFFAKDKEKLDQITVYDFAKEYSKKDPWKVIDAFEKRAAELDGLISEGKPLPFKTLVLDSLTTFVSAQLDYYIKKQPGIKRTLKDINAMQDYQLLDRHLTQLIRGLISLDANVVCTGHMHREKDETTGAIENVVLLSGKFASKLPIFFEEIYVSLLGQKGDYLLQTKSTPRYKCRTQLSGLPDQIPTSYSELAKYINQ